MSKKVPEYWVDVPGSIKYQVSNFGNFRRKLANGKLKPIAPYCKKEKWMAVKVDFKGKYREYYVHHIIAAVFLEAPESGMVLRHKNGFIRDNYAGNLEWISKQKLGTQTGGKTSRCIPVVKLDPITGEMLNFYNSISAVARDNFIHKETICQAIKGRLKTAAGYKWVKEEQYAI